VARRGECALRPVEWLLRRRWTVVATLLATSVTVTGCRFVSASNSTSIRKGATVVHIAATTQGCPPRPARVRAGVVDFEVRNIDAATVSEVEVRTRNLEDVLGERENLIQGLSGAFSATLGAGTYVVDCPGALQGRWKLVVVSDRRGRR
jgi:hypothetical protein